MIPILAKTQRACSLYGINVCAEFGGYTSKITIHETGGNKKKKKKADDYESLYVFV